MINQIIILLKINLVIDFSVINLCVKISIFGLQTNSSNIKLIIMLSCTTQTKFWDRIQHGSLWLGVNQHSVRNVVLCCIYQENWSGRFMGSRGVRANQVDGVEMAVGEMPVYMQTHLNKHTRERRRDRVNGYISVVEHKKGQAGQPSLYLLLRPNVRNGSIIIKDDHCKLFLQILP